MNISHIPFNELIKDKYDSMMDRDLCASVIIHATGDEREELQNRHDTNVRIIAVIDAEMERRGLLY